MERIVVVVMIVMLLYNRTMLSVHETGLNHTDAKDKVRISDQFRGKSCVTSP